MTHVGITEMKKTVDGQHPPVGIHKPKPHTGTDHLVQRFDWVSTCSTLGPKDPCCGILQVQILLDRKNRARNSETRSRHPGFHCPNPQAPPTHYFPGYATTTRRLCKGHIPNLGVGWRSITPALQGIANCFLQGSLHIAVLGFKQTWPHGRVGFYEIWGTPASINRASRRR